MIKKPLEDIKVSDLNELVTNQVIEIRTREYKATLLGGKDGGTDNVKKEFFADVSSFANAGGGDLIYGVDAKDGIPTAVPGLTDFNEDEGKLRVENLIRDSIEPRIPGVRLHVVKDCENGPALVIRIPRSWAGPHMVKFKNTSRFYSRNSAGKFQMDVSEIRSAFEGAGQLPKRIAAWRDERLGRIIANEGPFRMAKGGLIVVHLVPLASFESNQFDIGDLNSPQRIIPTIGMCADGKRFNLDGVVAYRYSRDQRDEASIYTQIFRTGCVEAVSDNFLYEEKRTVFIRSIWYESEIIKAVNGLLNILKGLGVETPILFMLSLTGVRGAAMKVDYKRSSGIHHPIDRDVLVIPDILIEDLECDFESIARVLKPAFDMVWNSCGYPRSYNYNEAGEWAP